MSQPALLIAIGILVAIGGVAYAVNVAYARGYVAGYRDARRTGKVKDIDVSELVERLGEAEHRNQQLDNRIAGVAANMGAEIARRETEERIAHMESLGESWATALRNGDAYIDKLEQALRRIASPTVDDAGKQSIALAALNEPEPPNSIP